MSRYHAKVDANHAESVVIFVIGTPAPQGSKSFKGFSSSGKAKMVESSKAVKPWREAVKWAIIEHSGAGPIMTMPGAVSVDIDFRLARPKSTKREYPAVKPDIDKLVRSTLDAMTEAGLIEDDSRVVRLTAAKHYVNGILRPGATITVRTIDDAKGAR